MNEFGLRGNWSDADFVSTVNDTGNTTQNTPPPPQPPSPSSTTPSWIYVVPAVVLAIVVGMLVIGGGVVLFRRYCFHRYVKMVSTNTCSTYLLQMQHIILYDRFVLEY